MCVLLVEDNEISIKIMESFFKKRGYELIVARDGRIALQYLELIPSIGLVITDLMLPEIDGFELTAIVKKMPPPRKIPLIICSVISDDKLVKKAYRLGADAYFIKPFNHQELSDKVREVYESYENPVREKREIMHRLELDETAFDFITREAVQLLEREIEDLREQLASGRLESKLLELLKVSEAALIWGCENLKLLIDAVLEAEDRIIEPAVKVRAYELLLRELERVRRLIKGDHGSAQCEERLPLHCAAMKGDLKELERILSGNLEVNVKDWFGNTPLHLASFGGKKGAAMLLLLKGANVNSRNDAGGDTPLIMAARENHVAVARILILKRADVNARNSVNKTPLHYATTADMAGILLENGAGVNETDSDDEAPLHCAARTGNLEVIKILVFHGADLNAPDRHGNTALHSAIIGGSRDAVELLLQNNARHSKRNSRERTPLQLAREAQRADIVETLERYQF